MSTPSNTMSEPGAGSQGEAPAALRVTRPLLWSVRRELWENRSISIGPLIVAAFVLFGLALSTITLPRRMHTLSALEPSRQHAVLVGPFAIAPVPIILAAFLVAIFYSLDALYGERRDRSILFWKSLPVSDLTTVLSKASIPLLVLPLVAFALSVTTQLMVLLVSTAVLLANGVNPAALWAELRFVQMPLALLYGLVVLALWHAPLYGWLLLVSAWARRTPVLWAALPPFAILVAERLAFGTSHFASLLRWRLVGGVQAAFNVELRPCGAAPIDRLTDLDPLRFLSTPGLWIGLLAASTFLAAAVRLRRQREPI